jgi:hypothetical protein
MNSMPFFCKWTAFFVMTKAVFFSELLAICFILAGLHPEIEAFPLILNRDGLRRGLELSSKDI